MGQYLFGAAHLVWLSIRWLAAGAAARGGRLGREAHSEQLGTAETKKAGVETCFLCVNCYYYLCRICCGGCWPQGSKQLDTAGPLARPDHNTYSSASPNAHRSNSVCFFLAYRRMWLSIIFDISATCWPGNDLFDFENPVVESARPQYGSMSVPALSLLPVPGEYYFRCGFFFLL